MALFPLLTTMVMEAATLEGAATINCHFPQTEERPEPVNVTLRARPSLMDIEDSFRVMMTILDKKTLRARAQPIASTDERDVMVRSRDSNNVFYTIGLRDTGEAVLNTMYIPREDPAKRTHHTRVGACTNHEATMRRWQID